MTKYHNIRVTIDNVTFASRAEGQRYNELKLLTSAGVISGLILQPVFMLQEAFRDRAGVKYRAITYVGDFAYLDMETGCNVVEDVKGVTTAVFLIKQKLFIKRYPNIELRVLRI